MLADSDSEEEDQSPPPVSALPSFGSDGGIPFESNDQEPSWLQGAGSEASEASSQYVTPFGTPMVVASKSDSKDDEEPAWLKQASARVSDIHLAVNSRLSPSSDVDESSPLTRATDVVDDDLESGGGGGGSSGGGSSPSKSRPRRLGRGRYSDDFGTDGGSSSSTGTAAEQAQLAFYRFYDASARAWSELRALSSQEISDGLLSLSVGCTHSMRASLTTGLQETGIFVRDVYDTISTTEPLPRGETRMESIRSLVQLRWRGLLQLPAAALYAMVALMHAVLAMMLTFLRHTPEAVRQFVAYVRNGILEYHESRLPGGVERVRTRREASKPLLTGREEEEE